MLTIHGCTFEFEREGWGSYSYYADRALLGGVLYILEASERAVFALYSRADARRRLEARIKANAIALASKPAPPPPPPKPGKKPKAVKARKPVPQDATIKIIPIRA